MTFLDRILATKRDEVRRLRARAREIEALAADAAPPRDFAGALGSAPGLAVIAELKRRSPSKGDLAPDLDPAATARTYAAGGASALSVLTDREWFGGSLDDLVSARDACDLPVLRKDFVIDPLQVTEARAVGADAVLLIVTALSDTQLGDLSGVAADHALTALVEVHDAGELDRALGAGCEVLGVNSRDLTTFEEDLETTRHLATAIPDGVLAVAESAIRTVDDAATVAGAGYRAALVGEALVRADDPAALVARLAGVVPAGTP